MAFGVFMHRSDSIYEDIPSEQYQFPKQYLSRAKQFEDSWVLYLEPIKVRDTRGYFAIARVREIVPDPKHHNMFLAIIEPASYLDFGRPVAFTENGSVMEQGLLNDRGRISGRSQAAVRPISEDDFFRIFERAMGPDSDILPRLDSKASHAGLAEDQTAFEHPVDRRRIDVLTNRAVRDRNFRTSVINAYNQTCAMTGLRLINGGGRAEVEAAHIRPVKDNGPDIVSNGIALSGKVHWMFDRGLLGLTDRMEILVSRQVNDPEAITSLINPDRRMILPTRASFKPRVEFVSWHRENCFKQ